MEKSDKTKKIISHSAQETQALARETLALLEETGSNLLLLKGDLGGGKTTFCQGVLQSLGAEGPFTSPTFVIMKKYDISCKSKSVYHIDCYRIGEKDILDLGWKEILSGKRNLVLVEWPEKIKKVWPKKYHQLEFKTTGESTREIEITSAGFNSNN